MEKPEYPYDNSSNGEENYEGNESESEKNNVYDGLLRDDDDDGLDDHLMTYR